MTEITHNITAISDIKIHYAESGRDKQDLVLLLHGFPEFWYTWRQQLPDIGERYHAVAPDMRGYNLSDKPEGIKSYRINHLMADMFRLVEQLGHEKFYLVAHDWGAGVAWAMAIAHPEKIKGLVIMNGPHPFIFSELLSKNETQIEQSQYMAYFRNEGIEDDMLANDCEWLLKWTFKEHLATGQMTEEDRQAYLTAWTRPNALKSMLNYYRASPLTPATAENKGKGFGLNPADFVVKVPTLVIWGEEDHALVPENLDGLAELVPDLEIVRLPNVTHWVTHEAPEIVSKEILSFVDKLAGQSQST
ncbi:alpha/beta hydrolase [Sneathiella marina]|uniref:Alpha/beta hydrolase n=1 Tax=Sneathiella marina TaxID=2950108 RepID=A0ABY4VXT7_9PROT|nr:alpha/beta hydrolase [Sneathiella marina]USG59461.1 alpha/beta hydrolase [Sneathiella marina]